MWTRIKKVLASVAYLLTFKKYFLFNSKIFIRMMNNNQIIRRRQELQHLIDSLCQKSAYLCVCNDVHNFTAFEVANQIASQNTHYQSGYGLLYGLAYQSVKSAILNALNATPFDRLIDYFGEEQVKQIMQQVENDNNA